MKILWRATYIDGSKVDNTQVPQEVPCCSCGGTGKLGPEAALPREGLVCFNSPDPTYGRTIPHGYNLYLYDRATQAFFGTDDRETTLRRLPVLFFGAMTSRARLNQLLTEAGADPDFPAYSPRRRKTDKEYDGNLDRQNDNLLALKKWLKNEILLRDFNLAHPPKPPGGPGEPGL
jgi:hypothetical protein